MKRIIRRIVVTMMCLTLLCTAAVADTAGLNRAAQNYLAGYENVQFHASAQLETLTPYGDGIRPRIRPSPFAALHCVFSH